MTQSGFASPIEVKMAVALANHRPDVSYGLHFVPAFKKDFDKCRRAAADALSKPEDGGVVLPHVKIGPYEADLLLLFRTSSGELRSIVVECDGHDFHEKTKRQAVHDKKRDRYLSLHSIAVLRFAGSEIWRDPNACADEVHETMLFMQVGPRETAWLGYLSLEEQYAIQEDEAIAAELEAQRIEYQRDELRREEAEHERKMEIAREMAADEGLYP